jgi:hypothetical protein
MVHHIEAISTITTTINYNIINNSIIFGRLNMNINLQTAVSDGFMWRFRRQFHQWTMVYTSRT